MKRLVMNQNEKIMKIVNVLIENMDKFFDPALNLNSIKEIADSILHSIEEK